MRSRWVVLLTGTTAAIAVAAVAYAAGQARDPAPDVVRAQRFELVDSKGRACAILAIASEGRAGDSGPGLALYDTKGTQRALLSLGFRGRPSLHLSDESGAKRAALGSVNYIAISGGGGHGAAAPESSLMLFNDEGQTGADLKVWGGDGNWEFSLRDKAGKHYWRASAGPD
jgi:hypothetical protein